jgi:dUTP pyrophosphatase
MNKIQVRVMRLPHAADLPLPAYQSAHAAGLDLVAAVPADVTKAPIVIAPGGRAAIPTGFAFALPAGIEGQIRPRSGLALHFGVTVLNSPGTLDADYRGELQVLLVNLGSAPFIVERGARIAQLVLSPTVQAEIHEYPASKTSLSFRAWEAVNKLKADLAYRTPSGRPMKHVVLRRDLAAALLATIQGMLRRQ